MENISRKKFLKASAALLAGGVALDACGDEGQIVPAITSNSTNSTLIANTSPEWLTTVTSSKIVTSSVSPILSSLPPETTPLTATTKNVVNFTSVVSTTSQVPVQTTQNTPALTQIPPTIKFNSASLDLSTKVGQRMLVVFPGTVLTQTIKIFLLTVKPGGIVLFADNISSLEQVKKLISDLQTLAEQNGLPRFIITLDEEGGTVSRMPKEAREGIAPSQMAQGAGGLEAVRACARETAARLANLGFNLNLAPVGDVNSNYKNPVIGTRSYGSNPELVAQAVKGAVEEYLAQKVGTCIKHFPGHGDTDVDSHSGLPVVNKSRAQLDELELKPFKAAIIAGTPAIMTGHILFPQIEPNNLPATLSPYFLTNLLRNELNFQGLIITDSLSMGAITSRYGLAEAARLSLVAGADMVIAINSLAGQQAVYQVLLSAAQRGDFEINKPVGRILEFKARYTLSNSSTRLQNQLNIAVAAQKSITLLRAEKATLLMTTSNLLLVNLDLAKPSQVEGQALSTILGELWHAKFPGQIVMEVSTAPNATEIDRVIRQARVTDQIVLITRDAYNNPAQLKLVQTLLAFNRSMFIVAMRGPYDLLAFPKATGYIVSYSDTYASVRALIEALTGGSPINGKLPVTIPGLYEVGAGLQLPAKS